MAHTAADQHDVDLKQRAEEAARRAWPAAVSLSHDLHAHPELAFEEHRSAAAVAGLLERNGFAVDHGVAGLDTAFVATAGSGELVVAVCAELDALPDVGHACGHNVIAAAAVTAGVALAAVADELGLTVRVYGTPAEEVGGGKVIMLERGAFDGVHAAMMVHPSPDEYADHHTRATLDVDITYAGKPAHAAAAPHEGVNALDAVTIAQVAIGLLRQQLPASAVVSGFVLEGGTAANVIPSRASVRYDIRSSTVAELEQLRERVLNCFRAGAVATGCELQVEHHSRTYTEFRNDDAMVASYRRNAEALGRVFSDHATLAERLNTAGSTDMANISQVIPTIHPTVRLETHGATNHQPEFAQCCVEESADRAILEAGTALAWTAIDLAGDEEQRRRLRSRETAPRNWLLAGGSGHTGESGEEGD
ncbi:MAG TPA: amidohydrolase [Segeticoccus sp.]|uniref:amidohydrolase n=1 Tax=Segeticoccus sp. TaxID=2706531 RepID=UPI002D80B830|nr:amidohydrolase [Segeticoccus sp.]HET8602073.1 amidohydrolase [Segeticoccus sp.]